MNESNMNLMSSSSEVRAYDTFVMSETVSTTVDWNDSKETFEGTEESAISPVELRPTHHKKPSKFVFSPKRSTTRFHVRSPKKVKSTSSGVRLPSQAAVAFNARARTKSVSSFGRLTSFMTGSPRPPIKYNSKFKTASRSHKDNNNNNDVTKTEREKHHARTSSVDSSCKDDLSINTTTGDNTTQNSLVTAPQATVDAARLALAARAEYAKRCNSDCLEKGTFYIVIDEKSKNDLVGKRASPGQLEDIGNQLLQEVQKMNEQNAANGLDINISNLEFTKVISSSKNMLPRKGRSKASRAQSLHSKRPKTFKNSQNSIASRSSCTSYQSDKLTPCSQTSVSNLHLQLDSPQSSILVSGISSLRLQLPQSAINNPLFYCNTADDESKSVAPTTNSTTINTPEDFISSPSPADFLSQKFNGAEEKSESFKMQLKQTLQTNSLAVEPQDKRLKRGSKESDRGALNDRKKDLLIKLHQTNNEQNNSLCKLSSTVSSVFERSGNSSTYMPFRQNNPITNTSANSKPVSPVSLAIAGVVMLSGTCAFVVSFAMGKHGNWTLAASVVMGLGAVAVFAGLCWYLAHTSAPPMKDSASKRTEIKVVDRKQLDSLIKKGMCVESVNNASSVA